MNEGPDYYRLADGSQFYQYSREKIVPMCVTNRLSPWETHCIVSACEHLFRMGAKEGEQETDWQGYLWWRGHAYLNYNVVDAIVAGVIQERRKVGR